METNDKTTPILFNLTLEGFDCDTELDCEALEVDYFEIKSKAKVLFYGKSVEESYIAVNLNFDAKGVEGHTAVFFSKRELKGILAALEAQEMFNQE